MLNPPRAEILCIGYELVQGHVVDTNSAFLARFLEGLGVEVHAHTAVGDRQRTIEAALRQSIRRSQLVITSGGLGPTADDLTREALAGVMKEPLVTRPGLVRQIRQRFRRMGLAMTPNNLKQARVPASSRAITNPVGTAPGILARVGRASVVCLPGVPGELEYLARNVLPGLVRRLRPVPLHTVLHSIRCVGIGESTLEHQIGPLIRTEGNPLVGIYAGAGVVELRVTARASTRRQALVLADAARREIRERLGPIRHWEGEQALPARALEVVARGGLTLATLESGTGGLLGTLLAGAAEERDGASPVLTRSAWIAARGPDDPDGADRDARLLAHEARRGATAGVLGVGLRVEDRGDEGFGIEAALDGGGIRCDRRVTTRARSAGARIRGTNLALALIIEALSPAGPATPPGPAGAGPGREEDDRT